jgi:hypothetical protein
MALCVGLSLSPSNMMNIIFTFGTDPNRPPLNFSLSAIVDQILPNARA